MVKYIDDFDLDWNHLIYKTKTSIRKVSKKNFTIQD